VHTLSWMLWNHRIQSWVFFWSLWYCSVNHLKTHKKKRAFPVKSIGMILGFELGALCLSCSTLSHYFFSDKSWRISMEVA
jgi:hypothetical protein